MRFSFHRWCAITFVVFAITLYTGKVVTENFIPKVYTTTTEVEVQVRPRVIGVGNYFTPPVDDDTIKPPSLLDEFKIIESPAVLLRVIQDLGLNKNKAKQGSNDQMTDVEALTQSLKRLKLDNKAGTNLIDITVSSDDPKEAADIVNAIADRYKTLRDDSEQKLRVETIDGIREQISEVEKAKPAAKGHEKKLITDPNVNSSLPLSDMGAEDQKNLIDELRVSLQREVDRQQNYVSPVQIISRAEIPEYPISPDKFLCFCVTVLIATLVSVVIGCFVEMILLFIRAAEGEHS